MAGTVCVVIPLGPACADITGVRAGDRNLITGRLTQNGGPLDLTGLVLTSQVRAKAVDPSAALTAEVTVVDAVAGTITVRWPGDDVNTLLAGKAAWKGVWDLQVQSGLEDPQTVVAGKWAAEMDVTR